MKFELITVTSKLKKPNNPAASTTEYAQMISGSRINFACLKKSQKQANRSTKALSP